MRTLDKSNAAVVQGQFCALLQFTKITSALERFASAHPDGVPKLVHLLTTSLRGPCKVHRRESALLLSECCKIPLCLQVFDENPENLAALVNAADDSSRGTDCSKGVEASFCMAFSAYVKAHILIATSVLWPASPKLGKALCRSVHKALPIGMVENIVTYLEQPLAVIQQRAHGPDKKVSADIRSPGCTTGLSVLTRSRLSAVDRIESLGTVQIVLRILRAALRWTAVETLEPALRLLETLCSIPFLHTTVAKCDLDESPVVSGLGLLLEVTTEDWDEFQKGDLPRHVNAIALGCIRRVVTPAVYDETSRADSDDIWQLFRINNGVRTVLNALHETAPTVGAYMRCTAARILLAMAPHPTLRNMLAKLGVPKLLLDILHDGASSSEPCQHFDVFKQAATLAVTLLTSGTPAGAQGASTWEVVPEMDSALKRLEKSIIVQGADIDFSQRELLEIVQGYLASAGLTRSAEALRREAKLGQQGSAAQGGVASSGLRPLHQLPDIVKGFLRKQHMECKNPISTLPAFSLRKGMQPALRAATSDRRPACSNVALRIRQRMMCHNTKGHGHYDRRLIYSHLKPMVLRRGHTHAQITSMQFDRTGENVFLGLSSGMVIQCMTHNAVEKDTAEFQVREDPEPVTGMRLSGLNDRGVIWSESMLSVHRFGSRGEDGISESIFTLDGRAAVFGNYKPGLLAVTSAGEAKASLYSLDTQQTVATFSDKDRLLDNELNLACTDALDQMLLSDSILYDVRQGGASPVYRYDKFTHNSRGIFAPSQNEVIIDKEVWDIRTHKLIRTVPAMAQTVMSQSPEGNVLYCYQPRLSELGAQTQGSSIVSVIDGSQYDVIASHDQADYVTDLAVDNTGRLLACALLKDRSSDTTAKLLQVGRSKKRVGDGDDSETADDEMDDSGEEGEEDEEDDDGGFLDDSVSDEGSGVTIEDWD
eukprot:TRINITY_DN30710_c0_g1_i2.p1 TRINITY_DN30710_c0_g1~~TRINITY_DN30710_c0_g1_i2.p1  ORF type:complete len:1073 (+),score=354.00 TRINITY_DN30710_c0_g1_i2:410-3220(+)